MKIFKLLVLFLIGFSFAAKAQDEEAEIKKRMTQMVENENPIYIPVVGLGMGILNFYVRNNKEKSVSDNPGISLTGYGL